MAENQVSDGEHSSGLNISSQISTNNRPIQRANDIIVAERERPDSADVPENYFGNADPGFRRYAANRSSSCDLSNLNIDDDSNDDEFPVMNGPQLQLEIGRASCRERV